MNTFDPASDATLESPHVFLTRNRFDLGIKLFFLAHIERDFALTAYQNDILTLTHGRFSEPDHSEKATFDDYLSVFHGLVKTFELGDPSLIPPVHLANDGTLLNGAHRVAAALHSGSSLYAVRTKNPPLPLTQGFYTKYGLSHSDQMLYLLGLLKFLKSPKVVVIWPKGHAFKDDIRSNLGPPMAEFSFPVSSHSLQYVVQTLYEEESWTSRGLSSVSITEKARQVFEAGKPITFYVLESTSEELFQTKKRHLRARFGLGYSSFHSTDTREEVKRLLEFLACEDLHIVFGLSESEGRSAIRTAKRTRSICRSASIDVNEVAVDGSSILDLYQIRPARDLDLVSLHPQNAEGFRTEDELRELALDPAEILSDPRKYCVLHGVKFLTLSQVSRGKQARGEKKDVADLGLIDEYRRPFRKHRPIKLRSRTRGYLVSGGFRSVLWLAGKFRRVGLGRYVDRVNEFIIRCQGR